MSRNNEQAVNVKMEEREESVGRRTKKADGGDDYDFVTSREAVGEQNPSSNFTSGVVPSQCLTLLPYLLD